MAEAGKTANPEGSAAGGVEIDPVTGQPTTGHVWDGIRELNRPLPRWWLWTFYATIAFSLVYVVLYPAVGRGRGGARGAPAARRQNSSTSSRMSSCRDARGGTSIVTIFRR